MKSRIHSILGVLVLVAVWLAIAGQRQLEMRNYVLDGVLFLAIATLLFLMIVSRGHSVEEPLLWPQNVLTKGDVEQVPLTRGRLQQLLLVAVVLLSTIAFASLAKNHFTLRGLLCWWGAVLAWLLVTMRVRPHHHAWKLPESSALKDMVRTGTVAIRANWATLSLLCILAVAFFFRVYRIDGLPPEPGSDQVEASLDVQDILNGDYKIFFPRNTGREATQFYLTAALSHVFGYGFVTLKLTMALVGVLNIIPMYFLGKELLDTRFGLMAAFFMAVSYWHVIISRMGVRIVLAPVWVTVTLYFLLRAFRTEQRNDYLWMGLSLGLGLYGYTAFRVVPLLLIVLCLLKVIFDREPDFDLGHFVGNVGALIATSMLVFLPMFRYMYDEPRMLWYRVLTRTTDLEVSIQGDTPRVFLDNVKRALLMFNWQGDMAPGQSVAWRPILDYVSAAFFFMGAAYMGYLLLIKRRPLALYLIVAMFVLLLPSTLALAFPIENPSNTRASGVIPVVISLVALPMYVLGRQALRALRGRASILLVVIILQGVLLWQAARLNFHTYFVDFERNFRSVVWNSSDMARVIRGFGDSQGSIYDAYIVGTPYWVAHGTVALLLGDISWNNLLSHISDAQSHLAEPRNRLYIFNPVNVEAEKWLREHYPNGQLMRFQASIPEKDFMIYFAPAQP